MVECTCLNFIFKIFNNINLIMIQHIGLFCNIRCETTDNDCYLSLRYYVYQSEKRPYFTDIVKLISPSFSQILNSYEVEVIVRVLPRQCPEPLLK